MTHIGKTTFNARACGAGSKSDFSDLLLNVPNMQNKPFFFLWRKTRLQSRLLPALGI